MKNYGNLLLASVAWFCRCARRLLDLERPVLQLELDATQRWSWVSLTGWGAGGDAGKKLEVFGCFGGTWSTRKRSDIWCPPRIRPYFFRVGKVVLAMCAKDRANYVYCTHLYAQIHTLFVFFSKNYTPWHFGVFLQTRGSRGFSVLMLPPSVLSQVPFGRCCGRWGWDLPSFCGSQLAGGEWMDGSWMRIHGGHGIEAHSQISRRRTCSANPNRDKDVMMRCRGSFWSHRPVR